MTTTHILGDNVSRKSNFDPDLAKKLTKYYEEHPEELEVPPAPVSNTSSPLEIIYGDYLETIQAAVPETIQTSAELQKARLELNAQNDYSLNGLTFYTANVPLYGVEKGKPFLLFGGREAFLRLYVPHIEEVYKQITTQQNYILPIVDVSWALDEGISSGALTRFDLAELIESRPNDELGYFAIDTKNAAQLSGVKRELAELIHGQGNDYVDTFKMLAEKGILKTKISLLNPEHVNSIAGHNLIGRASRLNSHRGDSYFSAVNHSSALTPVALRGIRHGGTS